MKKILSSLVTVFAVVAMVAGATQAVFSASDTVSSNNIAAATIRLDAREVVNKPMSVSNILPGEWSEPGTVDLFNDGSREQHQYMYVENVNGGLCPYVKLMVGYSWSSPNTFDVTFGTYTLAQLTGSNNRIKVQRDQPSPLPAGRTTRLVQRAQLDSGAPNGVQGASCTWDEVFVAEQPSL